MRFRRVSQAQSVPRLYADRVLATSRALEFLRSDRATPEDAAQFERDLGLVATGSPPVSRSPTVVELISTGRMGVIGTHELRQEIVRFDRISEDGRELLSSRAEYDLEGMRTVPTLLPLLSGIVRVHLMEVGWREAIAQRAAELRARLEEAP